MAKVITKEKDSHYVEWGKGLLDCGYYKKVSVDENLRCNYCSKEILKGNAVFLAVNKLFSNRLLESNLKDIYGKSYFCSQTHVKVFALKKKGFL